MHTNDLNFDLPTDLIATQPAHPRDAARLLVIDRTTDTVEHCHVADLADIFKSQNIATGDLMVFNHTRVLPARFAATRLATGGLLDGLFLNHSHNTWNVMLQSRGKIRAGERIALLDKQHHILPDLQLTLTQNIGPGQWQINATSSDLTATPSPHAILERIGSPPLPPYIRKQRKIRHEPELSPDDSQRYNTIFASNPGSVAAPTASLHFTPQLFNHLDTLGIQRVELTLHIGLGTFAPVRADQIEQHTIHAEHLTIPANTLTALRDARQRGARIIPVGTTAVRALESIPHDWLDRNPLETYTADTQIFIHPGPHDQPYPYRFTDALITNFHLPKSTLLAMVAALPGVGIDRLKHWYRIAIENQYRFYSYGDAMLIL